MHTRVKSAFNSLIAISAAGLVLSACSGEDNGGRGGTGGTPATDGSGGSGATGATDPGTGGTPNGTAGTGTVDEGPPRLCEGLGLVLSPDTPGDESVDDFEGDTHVFEGIHVADPTDEEKAEGLTKPDTTVEILTGDAVPDREGGVLHITTGDDPAVFWGVHLQDFFNCTDVSAFTGLSFWAKGTAAESRMGAVIEFKESTQGSCEATDTCNAHPSKNVTLTEEWTQYKIKFDEFRSRKQGLPEFYGSIVGVRFTFAAGAPVDAYLDDVVFYTDPE